MFVGEVTVEDDPGATGGEGSSSRAGPCQGGLCPHTGAQSLPPRPRCPWRPRPRAGGRGRAVGARVCKRVCVHAQTSGDPRLGSGGAAPAAPALGADGSGRVRPRPGCGRAGAYRRAEVAAAGAALVLHHPAPVVFTQHQERRLAGRAHQLVLDHAVGAPAQLQSDNTGQRPSPQAAERRRVQGGP